MPAITTNSKVLLTGATGFVGAWILKFLLEKGFSVRAAVRSQSKADHLRSLFKDHAEKLEFTVVEDITVPGAFDAVVNDVDGIIHSASPMTNPDPTTDPQELITPAVQGSLGILKSAKNSTSVKRVVITSSASTLTSLFNAPSPPYEFTEENWDNDSIKVVETKGRDAPPFTKYSASKTLAEKSAWKWMEEEKPSFDLVSILPGYVWGQVISETTPDIKGSNSRILNQLKKPALDSLQLVEPLFEWHVVDIREDALEHVQALLVPEAGGNRFISVAGVVTIQHILDILSASPIEGLSVPKGNPDITKEYRIRYSMSNEKSKRILGTKYRPVEETVRDTVIQALALGWTQ